MKRINIIGIDLWCSPYRQYQDVYKNSRLHWLLKQTPNRSGAWKDMEFFIDHDESLDFDGYVFINGIPEGFRVIKNKPKILIMLESFNPFYGPIFLWQNDLYCKQFDVVLSPDYRTIPNIRYNQVGFPWFVTLNDNVDYDFLKNNNISAKDKIKKCCLIVGNKDGSLSHKARWDIIEKIIKNIPDIDLFGRGYNFFNNQYDLYTDYKYVIVIENNFFNVDNYFTEKLSDAFLCQAYPIYLGCRNIHDYFDNRSLSVIDLDQDYINQIKGIINSNTNVKNYDFVLDSKNRVLDNYNLFELIFKEFNLLPKKDNNNYVRLENKGGILIGNCFFVNPVFILLYYFSFLFILMQREKLSFVCRNVVFKKIIDVLFSLYSAIQKLTIRSKVLNCINSDNYLKLKNINRFITK